MTDADYNAWLAAHDTHPVVLLEVNVRKAGVEAVERFSNMGYTTRPTDTPANASFPALLAGGIAFTERLGLSGPSDASMGDIEVHNEDGALDAWFDYVWTNRAVTAYFGDATWSFADFRVIFKGVIDGIDSRTEGRISLRIRDKLRRLETAVSETKMGGTGLQADALIPLTFGEVHNVTPLFTDPALLQYQVHNGPIERIIEVRDNGVPITFTQDLTTGKFTLGFASFGTITASVQGDKPSTYSNDISSLVQRLVKSYGKASERFTDADLDLTNLAAFKTANPQPVGVYIQTRRTVLEVAEELAQAVGARLSMSRLGKLRLIKLELPPAGTPVVVTSADMVEPLRIVEKLEVGASAKIGYVRNWTIQDNVAAGIPTEHRELYATEWLTATASDASVASVYGLDEEPEQENTMLLTTADAQAESTRRLNLRKVQRTVYEFEGYANLLFTELGSPMTIKYPRWGLTAGKTGQVVSLSVDWLRARVRIGVLI